MTVALDFAIPRTTGANPFCWQATYRYRYTSVRHEFAYCEDIARRPRITYHNLAS